MDTIKLSDLLEWTGGTLVAGSSEALITGVVTDSRIVTKGDCFVALVGERFDGHDFIDSACRSGASAVVYSNRSKLDPSSVDPDVSFVLANDTQQAYQSIARGYRRRFTIPVVGVTGSNGKTTTKDMTAAVLAERGDVAATEKNFNNDIGLPMTLLQVERHHKAAVVEMGMRGPGEIARLASVALPTIGVVTNVGPVHVEFFGSVEGVAEEKGALIRALTEQGAAVLNADDPHVKAMASQTKARVVTFGIEEAAVVRAENISLLGLDGSEFTLVWPSGKTRVRLHIPGRHHIYNALAAAAVGLAAGLGLEDVKAGLQRFRAAKMRTDVVKLGSDIVLIDDAYNSSPLSAKAAIDVLAGAKGKRKVAVLGDMLELGDYAVDAHRTLGRQAARAEVDVLVAVGENARHVAGALEDVRGERTNVVVCSSAGEASRIVCELVKPGDTVLVKASRGIALEQVTEALKSTFGVVSDDFHEEGATR